MRNFQFYALNPHLHPHSPLTLNSTIIKLHKKWITHNAMQSRSAESIKIPLDSDKWNFLHNSFFSSYLLNIIIITSRKFLNFITQWSILIPFIDNYLPSLAISILTAGSLSSNTKCEKWWHFMIWTEFFHHSCPIFLTVLLSSDERNLGKEFSNKYWTSNEKVNWFCWRKGGDDDERWDER